MKMMIMMMAMTPELLEALSHIDFEAWNTHVEWRIASDGN